MKKVWKFFKENKIYLCLITLLAVIFLSFIYKDNTLMAHDLSFHIANIQNLLDNNLQLQYIMPNLGHNLGYGLYIFYPFLPHFSYAILASILSCFSISTIDSILIMNVLISIISSIFMYALSLKLSRNRKIAFLSSIIYLFFPYRLGNITVRMAINENFAGLFLPIILLGISYLFDDKINKKKFLFFFIVGYTGLILSHFLIAFYFTIILGILLLLNLEKFKKKEVLFSFIQGVLAVSLLVLPNIILFLEHYGMDYLVYQENYATSLGLIQDNILHLKDFIIPTKNYDWTIPFYLYLPVILSFIYSSYLVFKKSNTKYLIFVLLACICTFIIVFEPLWNILPSVFYNIQFPWRLMLILSVFVSLVSPICFKKLNNKQFILVTLIFILFTPPLIYKLSISEYHNDYNNISKESGTGNIQEYYPTEYLDSKDYYRSKVTIDIISGRSNIKILKNNLHNNKLVFKVEEPKYLQVEFPRIYYKGYQLVDENKEKIELERCSNGLICASIEKDGIYRLEYVKTPLVRIFTIIRLLFLLFIIFKSSINLLFKNIS